MRSQIASFSICHSLIRYSLSAQSLCGRTASASGGAMEHQPRTQNEKLEVKTTTCYMCACRCGIRVHVRDGEVRYIDGNPEHPLNQGVICAKGASGIMKKYSPARITKPRMRK